VLDAATKSTQGIQVIGTIDFASDWTTMTRFCRAPTRTTRRTPPRARSRSTFLAASRIWRAPPTRSIWRRIST
jgi:hypothetical protein